MTSISQEQLEQQAQPPEAAREALEITLRTGPEALQELVGQPCGRGRGGTLRWGEISQNHDVSGAVITVSGIPALVCSSCDEAWLAPATAHRVEQLVRAVAEAAKSAAGPEPALRELRLRVA